MDGDSVTAAQFLDGLRNLIRSGGSTVSEKSRNSVTLAINAGAIAPGYANSALVQSTDRPVSFKEFLHSL